MIHSPPIDMSPIVESKVVCFLNVRIVRATQPRDDARAGGQEQQPDRPLRARRVDQPSISAPSARSATASGSSAAPAAQAAAYAASPSAARAEAT